MTRVIAGVAGGRRIAVPAGRDTRPTSDRAREGLFATVHSLLGPLDGTNVLDLYAGSGAVGLEALSRGAAEALMVESDPRAVRVIRENMTALGLPGARVLADRVERVLRHPYGSAPHSVPVPASGHRVPGSEAPDSTAADNRAAGGHPFDFVFADPPYALAVTVVQRLLVALRTGGWLAVGALVCVERPVRGEPLVWPDGYLEDRVRRYGDAALWYGHAAGP